MKLKYRNKGGIIINITLFREVLVRPRNEVFMFHAIYADLIPEGVNLACTTDKTKLWLYKSVCETAPESLFYGGPTCFLGFEYGQ